VSSGRVTPEVLDEGPFTVARWRPVLGDAQRDALAHAAAVAPAICRNGSGASTDEIVGALVDGLARSILHHGGWKPELGRKRSADVQALRAVFAALAKPDPVIRSGDTDFHGALAELTGALDRHRRRLGGEPVVRGRVRLTLPDDADSTEVARLAGERGVGIVPGTLFFPDGRGADTLRLSFSMISEAQIDDGIERLAGVLTPQAA